MYKLLITFCFLFFTFCLSAQNKYPFFSNTKGDRKTIADTVIIRIAPSTTAAFDDTLYFGTPVEVLMTVPYTETRDNMISPWLKVIYKKGRFKKIGFVSAIDVSLNESIMYKNYEFIWGVVANNKKDSVVNDELIIKNNYECKLWAIQSGKKVAETNFEIDNKYNVDSNTIKIIEKIKLSKTLCAIEIQNISLKDTTKELYCRTFVFCKSLAIAQLPITHNYTKLPQTTFPTSSMNINKHKNKFYVVTNYQKLMPENIVETYSWKEDNYFLVQ
jgi:hypothetical protein